MHITVLALDGLFDTGLTATLDAFATANSLSSALLGGATRFEVTTVGVRRKVRSGLGMTIPVTAITPGLARSMKWGMTPWVPSLRVVTEVGTQAAACGMVPSTRPPTLSARRRPSPVLVSGEGE